MTKTINAALIAVFAFIGIADAWYLAQAAYADTPLVCDINGLDGCNTVAQSVYSHLLGIPLGTYGVAFYAVVFVLAAIALAIPESKRIRQFLFLLGVFGAAASLVFVGIQLGLIKALCIYCLGSALNSFILFGLSWSLYREKRVASPVVEPWTAA